MRRSLGPVSWWALLGAAFLALQVYVCVMWLLTGDTTPLGTGPDPVPTSVKVWAWVLQPLVPLVFLGFLWHVVRRSPGPAKPGFDLLLLLGWLLVYWQDHMPVLLRPGFLYNSYLVNVASWVPHIPGWVDRVDGRTAAPLLLTSTLFPVMGLLSAVLICRVMGFFDRRFSWPRAALIAMGVLTGVALDLVCEGTLLLTGLIAYPGTVGALTLWHGTGHQFPFYEAVLLGSLWAVAGAVRYFRADDGTSVVERGVEQSRLRPAGAFAVRLLAVAGLLNLLFLSYALLFNAISLHGDPDPGGRPSYLRGAPHSPGPPEPTELE